MVTLAELKKKVIFSEDFKKTRVTVKVNDVRWKKKCNSRI